MSFINKIKQFFSKKSKRPRMLPIGGMNRRMQNQIQQARQASPGGVFSSQMKGEFDKVKEFAEKNHVSERCAFYVFYLRERKDWSQKKEDELIQLDKAGKPLPKILS